MEPQKPLIGEPTSLTQRLDALERLEPGWFDGGGASVNPAALRQARFVLVNLFANVSWIKRPRVYPTPEGNVQAEWKIGRWAVDLEFVPTGDVHAHVMNLAEIGDGTMVERIFAPDDLVWFADWLFITTKG